MALKYSILAELEPDATGLQAKVTKATKNVKIQVAMNMGQKDIDSYVKQWNNKIARMEFKSPDIFKDKEVQASLGNLKAQIVDFSSKGATSVQDVRGGFDDLSTSVTKVGSSMKNTTKDGYSFTSMLEVSIKKVAIWAIATQAIYGTLKQIGEGVQYIKDLNKELTNVQVVTGMTEGEVTKLALGYNDLAKEMGATTIQVAQGSLEWFRQGKTIEETRELMRSTLMLSKLGNLDAAQSTEYLTATLNGFKLEAEDSVLVVDKLIDLDNKYATSAGEIATALQYSSNSAQQAGVSFDELSSYVTILSSVTRKSAESIGQSLKTMFARLENIKLGKMFEDDTTNINDVEKALSLVNIKLRDTETSFRPMGDVMDEIASKWASMNELEQSAVANAIAGVRQRENFLVIMENYNEVLNAQAIQLKSAGLATERYEIYMESIEAKTNQLTASWELMWQKTLDSDAIKFFIDFSRSAIDATNSLGGLIPVLEIVIGLIGVLTSKMIVNSFVNIATGATAAGVSLSGLIPLLQATIALLIEGNSLSAILATGGMAATTMAAGFLAAAIASVVSVMVAWQLTVKKQNDLGLEATTNAWKNAFVDLDDELRTSTGILETYGSIIEGVIKKQEGWALVASLFIDKQEIIDQGLKETIKELKVVSSSYDEYSEAVKKAAELAGYSVDEQGRFVRIIKTATGLAKEYADNLYILSDAEFAVFNGSRQEVDGWASRWKNAISDVTDSQKILEDSFENLETLLADSFGKAWDSYNDKQTEATKEGWLLNQQIQALSELPYLSAEQEEELSSLKGKLELVKEEILKTGEAYKESTQLAVINLLLQKIAASSMADDAKQEGVSMVYSLAENLGLMSSETIRAMEVTDAAIQKLAEGEIEAARRIILSVFDIGDALSAVSGTYYIDIILNTRIGTAQAVEAATNIGDVSYIGETPEEELPWNPPAFSMPSFNSEDFLSSIAGAGGGASSAAKEKEKTLKNLHKMVMDIIKAEQDALKESLQDQKTALMDLLDAQKEIVDAKKEALNLEKESIEYKETLAEKTKDVAKIESEMAILALDTSASSKARQIELAEELANAQEDLAKTQREHSYDLQEEALDKEYESYEASINAQVEVIERSISAIDDYLSKSGQLAQDALDRIGEKAPDLYQSLIDWNKEYGTGIDREVTEAWNEAYDALLKYGNLVDALYGSEYTETANLPTHHTGISSGAVAGVKTLPGEVLSKLLAGEMVMNDKDMLGILRMIPSVAKAMNNNNQGLGSLNVNNLINIEGNVDKSTIPAIESIANRVIDKITSTMVRRGNVRDAASIFG